MKIKSRNIMVILLMAAMSVLLLCGCGEGKTGGTIEEPEITGEYLEEEYSQQLLTDGAEEVLGRAELAKNDDGYSVHIEERQIIESDGYEDGYYLADDNLTKDGTLGFDARIACLEDGELQVVEPDDFMTMDIEDDEDLFRIYMMGDSVEMILQVDPEEEIGK